jgi:hypothetical protein
MNSNIFGVVNEAESVHPVRVATVSPRRVHSSPFNAIRDQRTINAALSLDGWSMPAKRFIAYRDVLSRKFIKVARTFVEIPRAV